MTTLNGVGTSGEDAEAEGATLNRFRETDKKEAGNWKARKKGRNRRKWQKSSAEASVKMSTTPHLSMLSVLRFPMIPSSADSSL